MAESVSYCYFDKLLNWCLFFTIKTLGIIWVTGHTKWFSGERLKCSPSIPDSGPIQSPVMICGSFVQRVNIILLIDANWD